MENNENKQKYTNTREYKKKKKKVNAHLSTLEYKNFPLKNMTEDDWVWFLCFNGISTLMGFCCGPAKGLEERHELGITWNKYIEWKYKYSIGKRVLTVSLSAKVLGWS